jgi:DNA primase
MASVRRYAVRWDYEEASWILPIHGPSGELWGFQTKAPDFVRNRPPGIKKSRTLFGLHLLEPGETDQLLLVESPLDVLYLDSMGFPAVASFGANVSDQQLHLLVEHCESVILALDNDPAGIEGTKKALQRRLHHRLPVTVFDYRHAPDRKDPGECSSEQLVLAVNGAKAATFWP